MRVCHPIGMIKVVKRKLHEPKTRDWTEASFVERLEAVETISGIKKGKDVQQAFPRVHRITRKEKASPRAKDKIDFEELKRIKRESGNESSH